MPTSPVSCTIDLEQPGKQLGELRVPRSNNTSGWASLCQGDNVVVVGREVTREDLA